MKDFKNPNLYKLEQGTFETFVDEMLETNTQYNQEGRMRSGLTEEEEEETEYFGSIDSWGDDDMGGMGDFGFDFSSGLDNYSSDLSDKLVNPQGYTLEQMGTLQMLIKAPRHAIQQAGDAVINTKKLNDTTKKNIAKDWRIWGLVLGIFSFLGLIPGVVSFIYLPVGILMLISSGVADYYYGTKGGHSIIQNLIQGDETDFEGEEEDGEELEEDGLGLDGGTDGFGFGGNDTGFGGLTDFGGMDNDLFGSDETLRDRYADDFGDDDEGGSQDDYYDPESMGALATDFFPESPIDTSTTESFREGLLEVFKSGMTTKGNMLRSRDEMVKYYAQYMPNNDKAFARWTNIRENSAEYDNIAYTIYKSIVSINGSFDMRTAVPKGEKLTVMEMKRTPLIYKITVKLPNYIKLNTITNKADTFNDLLKATDDDEKVGTILTTFDTYLVVKFLRLDYKKLVSMGDLLRLNDEDSTTSFAEEFVSSKGVPMIAGMRDNEYPYMVDIVGNPAATIVGGSGSGKSWLTFQFMDSMLISNNPESVNFLILDAKDAAIWKQFALAPHVIGYHSDYEDFYNILLEVKAEHERRMAVLSRLGIESWKDYTERAKGRGDNKAVADMPLLFVIVDEITYTMSSLQVEDENAYKELKSMLTQLSSVIRASGIRMMLIGQRAIDTSIPKNYMANSPLKLAMKMNVASDFVTMLDKGYDRKVSRIPSGPGEGIMQAEGQTRPSYVKTVIPGGKGDGDILMQVRVLALDWVRRTQGSEFDYSTNFSTMKQTIKQGFNRDMYHNQALKALEEGRITDPVKADEEYLLAMNSPQANLIDNAVENIERKISKQPQQEDYREEEIDFGYQEEEEVSEDIGLDDFDWGSLVDEPEYDEPEYDEPEYEDSEDLEFEYEDSEELDFEYDEPEYEDSEDIEFEYDAPEYKDSEDIEFEYEEPEYEDSEELDIGTGVTELEQESEYTYIPEFEEEVAEETEEETKELDVMDMSLEDLLTEGNDGNEDTESSEIANEEDITTMLDLVSESQQEEKFDYTKTEEYKQFLKDKQEMEELKRKQQEMMDMLQKQQEEQQRKEEEESERKKQERLAEQKKQKELAEKKRIEEQQAKFKAEREALERQKQEIIRLQQQLEQNKQASVNETEEQEEEVVEEVVEEVKKVTPQPKPTARKKPTPQPNVKQQPKPQPTRNTQPKPDKEGTTGGSGLMEQPNTVSYQEMENMSVSQYVAKFGEIVDGQRRVKSQVINAKFNRRKVSLAIAIGEVYEEGEYYYYVG